VAGSTSRKATKKATRTTTQTVQAAVEGVEIVDRRKVEFMGSTFRMADSIGLMPLLKFAHASSRGLDSTDMAGLAALYSMIQDCIAADEWPRFEQHAIDTKAEADDLMTLVRKVIETLSARPTLPPGDSSAGRPTTSENSKDSSSSPATDGMVSPADLGH